VPNLKPKLGIGVVAAALGGEWATDPITDPWIKPFIKGDLQDVYSLEMLDPATSGMNTLVPARIE
jgi:hypothetical protein